MHRSLEFGDHTFVFGQFLPGQFSPGEQAAAMPAGFPCDPAQKDFGVRTLHVGFVREGVRACRRETRD